jgi:hypothetical protein
MIIHLTKKLWDSFLALSFWVEERDHVPDGNAASVAILATGDEA